MKKVLFITYFWPPSGKASVHWPLNMIKYLPEFDCDPSVLTVEMDNFSHPDESLLKEINQNLKVKKSKSSEPFNLYRRFIGKKKDEPLIASETISLVNKKFSHRLSIWIRMNLFIPDARIGWYFSAIKEGKKFLNGYKHDAIITIGPPHSAHLIGKKLSKIFKIPHVPVFIDPWTNIIYYKDFKRSKLTLKIDNYLEKKVLGNADKVVFVTKTMKKDYDEKYPNIKTKSHVLYWGYNEEKFIKKEKTFFGDEKIILHAGNIFDYQNPKKFWEQIKLEIQKGNNLKLRFIGTVSPEIKQSIHMAGLDDVTNYLGFLLYDQLIDELLNASYLLVCATEPRHVPGKIFEYLRTGNPIIAFGDDNKEVEQILRESNAGMIFKYSDDAHEFFITAKNFKTDLDFVKQFDRKNIAKELSEILKS